MKKKIRLGFLSTALLAVCFLLPSMCYGQALDNKGTDFIMAFLPNLTGAEEKVQLHLTGAVATTVTIQYPVNSPTFTTTATIVPGSVTIVDLPVNAQKSWVATTVQNNCVRAFADDEFVCYMINLRLYTSDAALSLPIDTMNTEYIVTTWEASTPEFVVFAAYDETEVTISPPGGSDYIVQIDRGQGYMSQPGGDPTGTIITATRPIGMTNGNRCVAYDGSACDHIFEVAVPVQAWGEMIPAANLPETSLGVHYKILAGNDNINVLINGVSQGTINRGEYILTGRLADDLIIEGTNPDPDHLNPIFVVQFMANRQSSGGAPIGDPAMGNMIPAAQYMKDYTFSTVGGNQFIENYLTVIADESDLSTIELDGVPIGAGSFTQIGTSDFYAARIEIVEGVHTTSSTGIYGHGITVEGFNWYDSYLYPGGALFEFINPKGDPWDPVCNLTGTGPLWNGSATDNTPSEDINNNGILDPDEDTNNNGVIDRDTGIFFVELAPGADNLVLTVDPFTPGDPTVTYTVQVQDEFDPANGTIIVTDGAGNTCEVNVSWLVGPQQVCDVNNDGLIDINDIRAILGARGTPASGPLDPADADGDGFITPGDAKFCIQDCDNPGCAP